MRLDDRITRLEMHAEQLLIHYRSLSRRSRDARLAREKLRIMFLRLLNLRRHQREMAADTLSPEVIAATAAAKPVVQPRA
jgi:hypothetical protein